MRTQSRRSSGKKKMVDLPHLNLRLTVGVDLSGVEEVATYATISLLNFVDNLRGRYHGQRPFGCTP
jgi:hypothetical protein